MEVTPKRKREEEEEEGSPENVRSSKREKTEEGPPTSRYTKLPVLVHNEGTSKPFSLPSILSRSVEIGVQLERYIEDAYESSKHIKDLPSPLIPCFSYLFSFEFKLPHEDVPKFKIKVFALNPSLISLKNNERIYCFRLKIFFLEGEITVKPIRNDSDEIQDPTDDLIAFKTLDLLEVWDVGESSLFELQKVGYFNCMALYNDNHFVRLLKVVADDIRELSSNSLPWLLTNLSKHYSDYQNNRHHRDIINTVLLLHDVNECTLFFANDVPCFKSPNFNETIFLLEYYKEDNGEIMIYLKPIVLDLSIDKDFNFVRFLSIHDIILRENKVDLLLISQQYAHPSSDEREKIKIGLNISSNPHVALIEELIVSKYKINDNDNMIFLETLKIDNEIWIGIGYYSIHDPWVNIENALEASENPPIDPLFLDMKNYADFITKSINSFINDFQLYDRAILDYYWNEEEETINLHTCLCFFYVLKKENYKGYDRFKISISPFFLPVNTAFESLGDTDPKRKEDYIFFSTKPTGIAHISKDEMLVTFTAGDYRSFEINFDKSAIIRTCTYDIRNHGINNIPIKIIDFRSNSVNFAYTINTKKTYIGNFTHKNLKDFIISIESDYRVTLLDRNTLQPSNDYVLTLEQLNKLCFE